jgi:glycosyltransferase involved in cell wall biosynthesis
MSKPELSIIIPFFNGEKYIKSLLYSLMNIKASKEILLIDDGSTKSSKSLFDELLLRFKDLKVFSKKNGGIADARNYGFSKATGDYVFFMDQDDFACCKTIDDSLCFIKKNEADICFWTTKKYENGHVIDCDIVKQTSVLNRCDKELFINDMLVTNYNSRYISYIGHIWQALIKRDLIAINQVKFKRIISIEDDFLFLFDCLIMANKICLFEEIGYFWRMHSESVSHQSVYIPDILNKYGIFYNYLFSRAQETHILLKQDFLDYSYQMTMIKAIENFTLSPSRKEYRQLKDFFKKNTKVLKSFSNFKGRLRYFKRDRRIFVLLHFHLFWNCIVVCRVDILLHSFFQKRGLKK